MVKACARPGRTWRHASGRKRLDPELLEHRFENGLDLWNGKPLEGKDAEDWLHLSESLEEPHPSEEVRRESEAAHQTLAWSTLLIRK